MNHLNYLINVSDVYELAITGPSGSAGAQEVKSINENEATVSTFEANSTVTWSLNGWPDASLFTINSSTGVLSFLSAPDYESPTDDNSNNDYLVIVRATDSLGNTSDQQVIVSVVDVDEISPTITGPSGSEAGASTSSISIN